MSKSTRLLFAPVIFRVVAYSTPRDGVPYTVTAYQPGTRKPVSFERSDMIVKDRDTGTGSLPLEIPDKASAVKIAARALAQLVVGWSVRLELHEPLKGE